MQYESQQSVFIGALRSTMNGLSLFIINDHLGVQLLFYGVVIPVARRPKRD